MKITRRQLRRIIKEITIGPDGAGIPTGGRMSTRGPGPGPFAEVWPYFEERDEGWKWKTKSSDEGLAFLPIHGSEDLGYYVKIDHHMGAYDMSWTKRIELPDRRVKVISPQNGWAVGATPNEIKTAVDEINYDISQHEATTDEAGMDIK